MPVPFQPIHFIVGPRMLGTPACRVLGFEGLYETPGLRGTNDVMPGAPGRRMFDLILDQREVTFYLLITGQVDDDGAPEADARAALSAYLLDFEADITPGQTGVTFEWHDWNQTLGADCQPLGLKGTRWIRPDTVTTSLDIILPPTLEVLP